MSFQHTTPSTTHNQANEDAAAAIERRIAILEEQFIRAGEAHIAGVEARAKAAAESKSEFQMRSVDAQIMQRTWRLQKDRLERLRAGEEVYLPSDAELAELRPFTLDELAAEIDAAKEEVASRESRDAAHSVRKRERDQAAA